MEKKGIVAEFKEFITRGNVMDMAVGIIIGGAFTAIVTSLVNDLLMPIIGAIFGGIDFTSLKYVIRAADEAAGKPVALIGLGTDVKAMVSDVLRPNRIVYELFIDKWLDPQGYGKCSGPYFGARQQ